MSFGSARLSEKTGRVLFLVFAVLLLLGCPTPPKAPSRVTPLMGSSAIPQTPASRDSISGDSIPLSVDIPSEPVLRLPRDLAEPVLPGEPLQLPSGLLLLEDWARLCGLYHLRPVPGATPYTVELEGDRGVLTLTLGQRFAKWNGINIGLGFAPGVRQGQMVVHSVDVVKNFYPLSLGTFSISKPSRVLVIDPGHGGSDPGSLSSGKIHEKELTLDWALRVEKLLANTSWKVILTRRDDRDVPRAERVAIADANQADIFISLHFNSLENGSGELGIETYCLAPAGAPSNINRNFEEELQRAYPNNQFDSENLLLAARLHQSVIRTTGRRDRGVRRARFMTVLREQKRPAVLIEGGFLSNSAEAALIFDPAYRQQMAVAVCNALPN
jgi:N-acetylmuramoyl-L-alanine amidase